MKDAATASYSKKGDAIVKMNHDAIDAGCQQVHEVKVPASWKKCKDTPMGMPAAKCADKTLQDFVNNIQIPCNAQEGDKLPVSTFTGMADGTFPQGSAAFEKRGIAVDVPAWNGDNCIQCNFCSYVCPHAVIRPVVMTDAELKKAPKLAQEKAVAMTGLPGYNFVMTMSALDCTGCGVLRKCLLLVRRATRLSAMMPLESQLELSRTCSTMVLRTLLKSQKYYEKFKATTVKGSQFKQPLLEFSGACAGCGETPYAKLITQLFGDRMYIANATGCSSIWGGSAPSTPYTVNKDGKGPAWANSLFEDNAEYGYGMFLAQSTIRNRTIAKVLELSKTTKAAALKKACEEYLETVDDGEKNSPATDNLIAALKKTKNKATEEILKDADYLRKKSMWIFGGDGWAYDIGFSGVDHVIAQGEDVNIFVFDTEVYSNTGGQSSKSTPTGAIAQFAAAGKEVKKKDLAGIAMSYGYVYVAHVAMGADYNQCIKAIHEAESYHGPSIIIGYAPCINHGIKGGMSIAQTEEKKAVQAGYWHLYRFDPRLKAEGKNPFILDSKAPTADYKDFIMGEVRYNALARQNPERAEKLFGKAVQNAKDRYDYLLRYAKLYNTEEK